MKKYLSILLLSVFFLSCNNNGETATTPADSLPADAAIDHTAVPPPIPLDTSAVDSSKAKVKKAMRK